MVIKDPFLARTQDGLSPQQPLWDALPDGLLVVDGEGMVRYANPAIGRIFGHETASLVGGPLTTLQPERFRPAHAHAAGRYARTGSREADWMPVDIVGLHRDGHELPLEITLFDLDLAGERMVGGILRDGSERQRAQAMQEALRKISEAAHSAPDLQGLFGQIH